MVYAYVTVSLKQVTAYDLAVAKTISPVMLAVLSRPGVWWGSPAETVVQVGHGRFCTECAQVPAGHQCA